MNGRLQGVSLSRMEIVRSIERWMRQDQQRLIRLLMVSGVMLFCAVILPRLPARFIWVPLVIILGLSALVAYLRWPPLGLLALLFIDLWVPTEVASGVTAGIHLPLLLLPLLIGLWLLDMLARQRKFQFVRSRAQIPLLAFAVAALFSFGVGQLPWFIYTDAAPITSQLAGLAIMLLSVAVFILTANLMTDLKWLKRLTWLFVILGSLYIFGGLSPVFGQLLMKVFPRGVGGSLLWTWLAAVIVSQALLNQKLSRFWRVVLIALAAGLFFDVLVLTYGWKSGWIPPLIVAGVIIWLRIPRLGVVLALGCLFLFRELPSEVIASDQYSYTTRLAAWQIILGEIVRANPFFGLGPANYYYYTPLYPIMGYAVEFNSHNNYVDLIAQTGVLGLALFLWFAWEMGLLSWRLWRELPPGFSKAYAGGVLAGLVATLAAGMLGDWFLPFVYNVGLRGFRASMLGWIFMGGLLAIDWMHRQSKLSNQEGL